MGYSIKNLSGAPILEGHEIYVEPASIEVRNAQGKSLFKVEEHSEAALAKCNDWLLSKALVHHSVWTKIFGLKK